jgi:protein-S-isoprenylcysteine O-methyltransferase Ste14
MPPLYVSDSAAGLVFWILFAGWTLVEMATYFRLRRASPARNRDRGSLVVLIVGYWLAIFLAFAFALRATFAAIGWHRHAIFYAGVGMLLGGLLLRQYAIVALGRLHTLDVTTRPAQPVVEIGPYRWIRHPSYAGAMLTAAGILLCSTNWLSLTCYVLVVSSYGYRIWVEEVALVADLGEPYRAYMRRTKRLIPYLI